jgi:hypothetical protein
MLIGYAENDPEKSAPRPRERGEMKIALNYH